MSRNVLILCGEPFLEKSDENAWTILSLKKPFRDAGLNPILVYVTGNKKVTVSGNSANNTLNGAVIVIDDKRKMRISYNDSNELSGTIPENKDLASFLVGFFGEGSAVVIAHSASGSPIRKVEEIIFQGTSPGALTPNRFNELKPTLVAFDPARPSIAAAQLVSIIAHIKKSSESTPPTISPAAHEAAGGSKPLSVHLIEGGSRTNFAGAPPSKAKMISTPARNGKN